MTGFTIQDNRFVLALIETPADFYLPDLNYS